MLCRVVTNSHLLPWERLWSPKTHSLHSKNWKTEHKTFSGYPSGRPTWSLLQIILIVWFNLHWNAPGLLSTIQENEDTPNDAPYPANEWNEHLQKPNKNVCYFSTEASQDNCPKSKEENIQDAKYNLYDLVLIPGNLHTFDTKFTDPLTALKWFWISTTESTSQIIKID